MSIVRKLGFLSLLIVCLAFPSRPMAAAQPSSLHPMREHVAGELLIKLRKGPVSVATAGLIDFLGKRFGTDAVLDLHPLKTDPSVFVFKLREDSLIDRVISALHAEKLVEYAEPNLVFHALDNGIPNDPDFAKSWGLHNTGQVDNDGQTGIAGADIDVLPLWQAGFHGSRKVLVAIVDTGIEWAHPDLKANLWTNPGEAGDKASNGKDDDGNGFVDDVHGWNFVDNNNNTNDDEGHGSHCAGIIGAEGNNGIGTTGVNWEVSLMPVKFLGADGGGSLEAAVNAVNYARLMKAQIINASWCATESSQALQDAISAARDAGILFVTAAGNDGVDNGGDDPSYPAALPVENIISVAAIDDQGKLSAFSNYGKKTVHVAAPGTDVYSTVLNGGWAYMSGTSMAAPHVVGIAALLLSIHPEWKWDQIKDRLIKTSVPVHDLQRKLISGGRVDAANALYGIVPPGIEPPDSLWKTEASVIESPHPYAPSSLLTYKAQVPGARMVRVHFDRVELHGQDDEILVESPAGEILDTITGTVNDYTSEYVDGDTAVVELVAQETASSWGFHIDKIQYIQ